MHVTPPTRHAGSVVEVVTVRVEVDVEVVEVVDVLLVEVLVVVEEVVCVVVLDVLVDVVWMLVVVGGGTVTVMTFDGTLAV